MFTKLFQTFNIVHICLGTITLLFITSVFPDNIRQNTGMWSYDPQAFLVYNQISNKHPSQYRKLYWYPTRMPTVPTQKQRMGKFLVTHGYASVREHSPYNGLQIRNTFKNTYDGYLSPQVLRTYLRSAKLPTTSATTTTVCPFP
ncbi:uncharacterized protein [Drosophila virilis]|uniref:uncharacterized protein n=1 Tax=Drosophila virilis TaxID=7244 RepID=UPI0038B26BB8